MARIHYYRGDKYYNSSRNAREIFAILLVDSWSMLVLYRDAHFGRRVKGRDIRARSIKEAAATYGVTILRADVKDLVFPGNLQEIMNRVLAAEGMSQAQLVEARTKSEVQRMMTEAEVEALQQREQAAKAHRTHPALLRLQELSPQHASECDHLSMNS